MKGELCLIEVLDTSGLFNEYSLLLDGEIRGGDGFMCVYSVDDILSYEMVDFYMEKIRLIKPKAPVLLVSNKVDIKPENRKVNRAMEYALSRKYGGPPFQLSAKLRLGLEEAFSVIVISLQHAKEKKVEKKEKYKCCTIC